MRSGSTPSRFVSTRASPQWPHRSFATGRLHTPSRVEACRHGQDQSRGGSVRAEGRKPKALLTEDRLGFNEQKRELQAAVGEQPKPLAYDTPADGVRSVTV